MIDNILILLPLLCLLPVWYLAKKSSVTNSLRSQNREGVNVAVFNETKTRLQLQLAQQEISQSEYDALFAELARDLLDNDLESQFKEKNSSTVLLYLVLLVIPLLSVFVYLKLGYSQDIQIKKSLDAMIKQKPEQHVDSYKKILPKIEKRFKERPEKVAYGFMLAQGWMQEGKYQQAADAYDKILEVYPEDPRMLAMFAQASYLANSRKLEGEAREAAIQALNLMPNEKTALGLMGMASFEEQSWQQAISYWRRLLVLLPSGSADAEMITKGIQSAQQRLGVSEVAPVLPATLISLSLRLKPGLELAPHTPVFVAVRDKSRGMPIVAKKLRVDQLPLNLNLSDMDSLMPQRPLSSMKEVELVARVSFTGQPVAQKGDYQSEVIPVVLSKEIQRFDLEINQLIE